MHLASSLFWVFPVVAPMCSDLLGGRHSGRFRGWLHERTAPKQTRALIFSLILEAKFSQFLSSLGECHIQILSTPTRLSQKCARIKNLYRVTKWLAPRSLNRLFVIGKYFSRFIKNWGSNFLSG
jgi:hypothetical protein